MGKILDNLTTNTTLDTKDIKKMGQGFYHRLVMVRSQARQWQQQGYSFRRLVTWANPDHRCDSKIPLRPMKNFWHEVDLLKRIILLAEFCKANGLDFQKEFEKDAAEKRRQAILNKSVATR